MRDYGALFYRRGKGPEVRSDWCMESMLTLSDGRELSYAIYGDPAGKPLLALHGSADSRLIWQLLDADASDAGVRLVAPDRPGFGDSPYSPGRTTIDHASDVVELADHLDLGRFAAISISGGLVFGLALAWAHPERVRRFTSYAGLLLTAPGAVPEMNPLQRMIASIGLKYPAVLKPLGCSSDHRSCSLSGLQNSCSR